MKIAQVCHRYYPHIGGVETHVKEISERLSKRGFEVDVLTTDPSIESPKDEVISEVRVKRFKSWAPGESYHFSMELKRYLAENSGDYDIVHAHSYHDFPALYAAQGKKKNRLTVSPHYHGTGHTVFRSLLHIPYKFFGKKIFEKADKIVCVSSYESSLLVEDFRVDEDKVVVIPNGVNLEEFRGLEKQSKDERVVLYIGRLERYKGVQYLIRALQKMNDDIFLEVVGKGPYKESLVRLARKLGVESKVRFFQDLPRKELLQRYVDADLFVLLSKHEAYGISVAEALAAKTPCIISNTSALKEWVDDKNCFGISYPINLDELVNLMNSLIGKAVTGELRLIDWNEATEKLVDLYESCLRPPGDAFK